MKKTLRLVLVGLFLPPLFLTTGCINVNASLLGGGTRRAPQLQVIQAAEEKTKDKILLLDITGPITMRGAPGLLRLGTGSGTLVTLKDQLLAAEDQAEHLVACILNIDTPGGGVTASDLLHHELTRFQKRMTEKRGESFPLIAHMGGIATSGGVYAAMAADEIHAYPTTTTGSIGVIAMWPGVSKLSETVGFEMRVFKSGDKKDAGSPWRDLTEEERGLMQGIIDNLYARFLDIILESREDKGLTEAALRELADGRVFKAQEALDAKLIDGIAYPDELFELVKERIGGDADLVSFEYPGAYRGNIYAQSTAAGNPTQLQTDLPLPGLSSASASGPSQERFHYLWVP